MSSSFKNPRQKSNAFVHSGESHSPRQCSNFIILLDQHSFFRVTAREPYYCEKKCLGLFTTVVASSSVEPKVPYHGLLSNAEMENIEEHAGFLYVRCWQDDIP